MAQADSQSTTGRAFVRSPDTHFAADAGLSPSAVAVPDAVVVSGAEASDPIFAAIKTHKRELDRRNQTIEAICAAEERHKADERETWHRYEAASIALLTAKPTTLAGVIALLNYVALPECSGPGKSESILDGARLSSNQEAAAAAERFPVLSAEALGGIAGEMADIPRVSATDPIPVANSRAGHHAAVQNPLEQSG